MPDSFQLILPEPDPDETPLEVEGQPGTPHAQPVSPPDSISGLSRSFARQRAAHLDSFDLCQPDPEEDAPGETRVRDPDELWQENADREAKESLRFSLAEMFFVTALLAAIFTVGRFVRLPMLAGVLGVLVLLGLGVVSNHQRSRIAYVVWISLIAGYVFVSIGAAWKTGK